MVEMKRKTNLIFSVLFLLVFMSPAALIAGEEAVGKSFQKKIQQRINAPRNVQFNIKDEDFYYSTQEAQPCEEAQYKGDKEVLASGIRRKSREPLADQKPIMSSYAIYNTDYKAELEEDVVTVSGRVLFEVFRKGWTQLPLVSSDVGLIDVSVNRGASFVTMQGGKYYLMIDRPGRYNLDIEFLIKAQRERENGPGSFSFEVMSAPISQFEFTMPEAGVEIFVEPAIKTEVKKDLKRTVAWAVMPNTNTIQVRWTKALPKEIIKPVELEPKAYVQTNTYASVGEGFIRCQTTLNYSILQSEISSMRIALPQDISVLDVRGRDLRDWMVSNQDGQQYLDVYLNFGIKGSYALNLSYERNIGEGSVVADVPWVKAVGVERETGYFGLAAATNVELAVNKIEHVTLIDVKELSSAISRSTAHPILLAFKYLKHPFSIAIDVTRHEELPVLVAAIDSVNYVTLQTDEGKSLTKAIYQVRNNVKQFLHLVLPKNAILWSVFVSEKPVKPAKDKDGSILIPLEKSQFEGESLTQFPVEIVYLDKIPKMGLFGNLRLNLPQTDIPVSELNWAVYLPLDYAYFNFSGDVKLSREKRPLLGLSVVSRIEVMKEAKYDRVQTQYASVSPQVDQAVTSRGVLPIKINIPEQGRLYRFSKLLVTEKESPWLSVKFSTVFKKVHGLLRFLILAAILSFIVVFTKRKFKRAQ